MLLVNKKTVRFGFDVHEAHSVGIKCQYIVSDMPAINLISRMGSISKAEARRKIKQGAVWFGNEKCTDPNETLEAGGNAAMTVFIGKELQGVIVPLRNIKK